MDRLKHMIAKLLLEQYGALAARIIDGDTVEGILQGGDRVRITVERD